MSLIKNCYLGIRAIYRSSGIRRQSKKIKREIAAIETKIQNQLLQLGKEFSEKNTQSSELVHYKIPQFLEEIKKNQEADSCLEDRFHQEMDVIRQKEIEQETLLPEKEKIEKDREQVFKKADAELKGREMELKKIEASLAQLEKRKQRASQAKTMIPVPLLNQEVLKNKRRMEELIPEIEEKHRDILPLKEAYESIHSECNGLRNQIQNYQKEIQKKTAVLNKEKKGLQKNRAHLEQQLQDSLIQLGTHVEQHALWSSSMSGIHDDLLVFRKQIAQLKQQIGENAAKLQAMASDRKVGWLFFVLMLLILLGSAGIYLHTRLYTPQ
ncbi:MAG: hypothetical protein JW774_11290 [Candidatus Aureabacteria bacterium]|nr:hypothetical protein [Candidatus Auribacterota bacterium]